MYDTQLVTELKNGGSELIYRLIEPRPRKTTGRSEAQANARLAVSRDALDFILHLSFSLGRPDWEKHVRTWLGIKILIAELASLEIVH